jgi:carboxyl-terminal processing protease
MPSVVTLATVLICHSHSLIYFNEFEELWQKCRGAIARTYFAKDDRKTKMEAILDKWEPVAKAATTRDAFDAAMDAMIADFKDSHFDFLSQADQGFYMFAEMIRRDRAEEMPHMGAWFKKAPDGYTVTMVLNGMAAEKAGLQKGDVILQIAGTPFTPVESLRPHVGKTVPVEIRRGREVRQFEIDIASDRGLAMFLKATRNSIRTIEHQGKKYGYIHLWTMASDDFKRTLEQAVYGSQKDTDGFILDIRDGFGGRPEGFGDPFFRPEAQIEWKFGGQNRGNQQLFGYGRPLVVLINGGSRSAKEVFSYIIKKSKRGTLIGSRTAGAVLGTSPNPIADWAFLEVPMVDVIVDGQRLEGIGVEPDIPLPRERSPEGRDLYLEAALNHLSSKSN